MEGTEIDPKDNEKSKVLMNGRLPSPPRNRVRWTRNKVNFSTNPPPYFPIPGPYNFFQDISKVLAHMTFLDALITLAQFENLSCVLQAPPTP